MGLRQSREQPPGAETPRGQPFLGCFNLGRRKSRLKDEVELDKGHEGLEPRPVPPPWVLPVAEAKQQTQLPVRSSGRSRGGKQKPRKDKVPGGAPTLDLINQLPEECLAAIFEKAGGGSAKMIAAVCRKWKEISVGSRSVFLLPQCDPESLGSLLSLLPGLTSLKVARTLEGGCFRTSDDALAAIGRYCPGLEAVDLGYNFLEGDKGTGPMQDAPRCGSYISIGGDGSSRDYTSVTSKGIALLAQQCTNLRRLGLRRVFREETRDKKGAEDSTATLTDTGSDGESSSGVDVAVEAFLTSVSEIQEGGVEKVAPEEGIDAALAALARYCSHLEYLNLAYCSGLSNQGLQEIGFITTLTTLDLSGSSGWSDEGLELIGAGCRRLRHLSLACVSGIRDSGLQLFAAKGCPNLRTVIIWGAGRYNHVSHVGIAALGEAAPGLRCLDLTMAKTVSDEWLASIGKKCAALEELCLDYCDCSFSQEGIERLVQGCRQLEKLRVGGVIDGRGLSVDHRRDSVLFPLRAATNLKALDLRDCQGVTDSLLGHIVAGCPQMEQLRLSNTCIKVQRPCSQPGAPLPLSPLKKLNLGFCRYLKRDGLLSFLSGSYAAFPRLEELSMRACLAADDEVLDALATSCTALRRLDLTGCRNVSDRGLEKLSDKCKQLAWLNLSGCDRVTGEGFKPGCPSLTLLCIGKGMNNAGAACVASCCPQLTFLLVFLEPRSSIDIRQLPRKLTNTGIKELKTCRLLQTLRLCHCDAVSDEVLERLAARLPFLRQPYRLTQHEQDRLQRLLKVWFSPGCLTRVEDTWPLLSNSLQFFDPQLNATLDT